MDISVHPHDEILEIGLNGRLDAANSAKVQDALIQQIDSGSRKIVMDFSHLDYISSSGLRVLLVALKLLKKENGRMYFYGVNEYVREVFDLAGLLPFFPIYADCREAIDALKQE